MVHQRITQVLFAATALLWASLPSTLYADPLPVPSAPQLAARSYVLMDATTGKILAESKGDTREQPASLTKLMNAYIDFRELKAGRIHLTDEVTISKKAWQTGGSRTFVQVGTQVPVEDLIQGMVVQSGNDASVALAQYVAGSTSAFVQLMNQAAQQLGMKNTHFADVDGLPKPDHYSTAHDLAILTRALILDFPEYYHYFKEGHYTFNHITQYNRNRLLWRDPSVDGLKTGHTEEAGYCLIASAKRGDMRLISVVMGADSDNGRVTQSQALLDYGFRFYETRTLYKAGQPITEARVWKGAVHRVPLGVSQDLSVTFPRGQSQSLKPVMDVDKAMVAPVTKGQTYGQVNVSLGKTLLAQEPLIALHSVAEGSLWQRLKDDVRMRFHD
ncbi:MAG: serine-type D-Ala-D-Ala carboxypeptidase [Chromatiales bacterium 21-64-14]|nr:MAG: serine-type D-Ala-D-Ala carboxypeptidase [Chromatiales bacterium 21-64-14]HQU15244.1 D-alanyl-D-alanine carboxypeptidase family protein [Gammaproteobacteria bacterium]